MTNKVSEAITENIFRNFHGAQTFIEKTAIPKEYGFTSKSGKNYAGYPDFFKDEEEYSIIVEAKATKQEEAEEEIKHYMIYNHIKKDIIGIAFSGQTESTLKVSYYFKELNNNDVNKIESVGSFLIDLNGIKKVYKQNKYGDSITTGSLISVLKNLNNKFNKDGKVRATDRSLFFSGLMIALNSHNFRSTYKTIQAPSNEEISTTKAIVLESHNLNNAIISSISNQLTSKINNLSKEFSWKDKFSFIKNIDYSLMEYKEIIGLIEDKIFKPFKNDEKQDILGRAYKIFLSRAGKAETKNIILTPDHIKELMVKLARLNKDDVVLDTCTGSGGFLMESMEVMTKLAQGDNKQIEHIKEKQLIGFEIDSVLFSLACSNMFLHGDGKTNLLYRSSLLGDGKSSVINGTDSDLLNYIKGLKPTKAIINPPYENNSSIKFTKQALDYLEPNGKLIVIMPNPTLTQNQNDLTKDILKIAKLDFVIKMPSNLFSEQKRIVNTSIFGFTKTPHNEDDEVLFYNLEDDGLVSIQNKGRIDKNNKWQKIENEVLDTIKNSKEIKDVAVKKKIYKDGILNCAGVPIKSNSNFGYEMIQVKDIFNINYGSLASNDCDDTGVYDFITAGEEWKKHNEFTNDGEALVYAVGASGSLGRCHYVNGKFIASNLCFTLTKKESKYAINMEFYNQYFNAIRKRVVSDLADGTSKLTISMEDLNNYYIEYIPMEKQKYFVENNLEELKKVRNQLKEAEKKVNDSIKNMI